MKVILQFGPNSTLCTTKSTLELLPYFVELFNLPEMKDTSTIFLDRDYDAFSHILELLRNWDKYPGIPDYLQWEFDYFNLNLTSDLRSVKVIEDKDIVKLNVGGELFWTTRETIGMMKNNILDVHLSRWSVGDEIFLDRSPVAFKEILSYLRNPTYPFPIDKLSYELDYYGIKYEAIDLENKTNSSELDQDQSQLNLASLRYTRNEQIYAGLISAHFIAVPTCSHFQLGKQHRCTDFSKGWKTISSDISAEMGKQVTFKLMRGDIEVIRKFYLLINVNQINLEYLEDNNLIFKLIKSVEIEIGSMLIDKFDGDLLYLWIKLYHQEEYENLIKRRINRKELILPLHFVFHDWSQTSLKLLSLFYHEIRIIVTFADRLDIPPLEPKFVAQLLLECINLSDDEFRAMRDGSSRKIPVIQHNQKIEKLFETSDFSVDLNFNKYVCQLIMVIQPNLDQDQYNFDYGNIEDPELISAEVYFNDYHVNTITPLLSKLDQIHSGMTPPDIPIYTLTYSLQAPNPNNNNWPTLPGRGIDFNKIENIKLKCRTKIASGIIKIWAINYNIFEYNSGMGQVMYY